MTNLANATTKDLRVKKQTLRYPTVLSIAGSDSGGGAGVQADIKTLSALGCYATTAITALTAQNTLGVQSVHAVPSAFLEQQIKSVLDDMGADSVKVGMFASLENLAVICELLNHYPVKHVVFDPVMISSSGTSLVSNHFDKSLIEGVRALMRESTLFTPNLHEASYLLGRGVKTTADMQEAANAFIDMGANAVLIKGGHLELPTKENPKNTAKRSAVKLTPEVTDLFMDRSLTPHLFSSPRIKSANLHGTGCTLSSAIAAYTARGMDLMSAVQAGRAFVIKAIKAGKKVKFNGSGPLNQGFAPMAVRAIL
jgi:hydroxymethylpyrimidine/phosphomethylpyrimidine kinase